MEQREAQRLDRLQHGQRGVFARSAATFDAGLDLKIGQEVVREGDELLPVAVRRVGHRRHRRECLIFCVSEPYLDQEAEYGDQE